MVIDERDAIKRERMAYATGRCIVQLHSPATLPCATCVRIANDVYQFPKVERPRVVQDEDGVGYAAAEWTLTREWRCVNGQLQSRSIGVCRTTGLAFPWANHVQCIPTPARVKMWADLLETPNEYVEDGQ